MEDENVPHNKLYIFVNLFTIIASIVIIYLIYINSPNPPKSYEAPKTLEFAIIVFRHGSRTPVLTFPTDTTVWPEGRLTITAKGKVQMFRRGQMLRERYGNFFNYTFRQEDFLIRTTNSSRTRMSLEILLSGMFPPDQNRPGNWKPVQIWTDDFDKHSITVETSKCPKYGSEQFDAIQYDSYLQNNLEFIEYLFEQTQLPVEGPLDMMVIWDVLKCSEENGYPIPNWATKNVTRRLTTEIERIMNSFVASSPRATTFVEGPLIHYFDNWLTQKLIGNATEKILIHSGHDYTLLSLLSMVGFKNMHLIPPASVLIFEVHKAHKAHEVKLMLYNTTNFENNEEIAEPIDVNMPRCSGKCSLDKFLILLKEYGIDENVWIEKCFEQ